MQSAHHPVPVVLAPLTLPALLDYIIKSRPSTAQTTLIICSSRDSFLHALASSVQPPGIGEEDEEEADPIQRLTVPTLHNLFTAKRIDLAFCASVQALLAYLAAFDNNKTFSPDSRNDMERLVLVDPLALHVPTAVYSAQGLSRTFAAATETALRNHARLLVVECLPTQENVAALSDLEDATDVAMASIDQSDRGEKDPWEQQVPILNISLRRFGSGNSERPWGGRSVKARTIAARWFQFQRQKSADEE